jgi:hypothetical protein
VTNRLLGILGQYFTIKVPGLFVIAADINFQPILQYLFIWDDYNESPDVGCNSHNGYFI